jgi:hypothetical protein
MREGQIGDPQLRVHVAGIHLCGDTGGPCQAVLQGPCLKEAIKLSGKFRALKNFFTILLLSVFFVKEGLPVRP